MEWGFYDTPYGPAFVTQGAGESGAKIRFLTSPEVVVLKIGF
jgi:predicted MPP superfamily phosphohydrolase